MNTADNNMDRQVGVGVSDATGEGGSYDMVNPGVANWIARKIGVNIPTGGGGDEAAAKLGTTKSTQDMVKEGAQAKPEEADLSSLAGTLDEIQAEGVNTELPNTDKAVYPEDQQPLGGENPGISTNDLNKGVLGEEPASVDQAEYLADVAAKKQEELEARTWERNINLDYMQHTDDIGAYLEANADTLPSVDHEKMATIEADVGGNELEIMRGVINGEVNGNLNSRQLLAGRRMLISMVKKLDTMADELIGGKASDDTKLKFDKLQKQTVMLQKYMQGQIRETARALNSMKIVASTVNSRDLEAMENLVNSQGESYAVRARMFKDIQANATDTADSLDQLAQMTAQDRVHSLINLWTASILSGFRTQEVNFISNATWALANSLFIKPIAGVIGATRRKLTGATDGVYLGEFAAEMLAWKQGMRDALMMGGKVFSDGVKVGEYTSSFDGSKTHEMTQRARSVSEALGVGDVPVISHMLNLQQGITEAASYGALSAADEYFKAMAYRQSIYAQSVRIAYSEGTKGNAMKVRANELMNNITAQMHEEAIAQAERMTFQNDVGGYLGSAARSITSFKQEYPLATLVFPFVKTPTALLDRTLQMTPGLNLLQKDFRDRVAKGGADADVALAEMAFGTALFTFFGMMYSEGKVTGAGPSDPKQRAALEAMGWQKNSIRIGDSYYAYNRGLDPFGMALGATFNMLDSVHYAADEATAMTYVAGASLALAKHFKDSSWMKGAADVSSMVDERKSFGRYASRQIASLVPSLYRDIELVRRGLSDEPSAPAPSPSASFWKQLDHELELRIPGNIGPALPPKRYWNGKPIVAVMGEGLWMYNSLSPIRKTNIQSDPGSYALASLRVKVTPPNKKIPLDPPGMNAAYRTGMTLDLIDDLDNGEWLYDELQELVGQERAKEIDWLVKDKSWNDIPDGWSVDEYQVEQGLEMEKALQRGLREGQALFLERHQGGEDEVEKYGPNIMLLSDGYLDQLENDPTGDNLETLERGGHTQYRKRKQVFVPNIGQ